MRNKKRTLSGTFCAVVALAAITTGFAAAQSQPQVPAREATMSSASVPSQKELAATQEQLIKLLRLSPTMTEVISRDPSLLSDQEYVTRNNPELAQFLQIHPEVARNPSFYLFTGLNEEGEPENRLERRVWPENFDHRPDPMLRVVMNELGPFIVFVFILFALLWLIHVLLENRRWGRIFKLQMEAHGKLIDRFSTNQELLVYMETEAGKRFLEAAPIPVDFVRDQKMPSAVARVLTPLQIGLVLFLLGVGLIILRHSLPEIAAPLLILGVVALMPGLGFILSAGVTWALAGRLGLMPDNAGEQNRTNIMFDSKERL
jgi:hypothetical protein